MQASFTFSVNEPLPPLGSVARDTRAFKESEMTEEFPKEVKKAQMRI